VRTFLGVRKPTSFFLSPYQQKRRVVYVGTYFHFTHQGSSSASYRAWIRNAFQFFRISCRLPPVSWPNLDRVLPGPTPLTLREGGPDHCAKLLPPQPTGRLHCGSLTVATQFVGRVMRSLTLTESKFCDLSGAPQGPPVRQTHISACDVVVIFTS